MCSVEKVNLDTIEDSRAYPIDTPIKYPPGGSEKTPSVTKTGQFYTIHS